VPELAQLACDRVGNSTSTVRATLVAMRAAGAFGVLATIGCAATPADDVAGPTSAAMDDDDGGGSTEGASSSGSIADDDGTGSTSSATTEDPSSADSGGTTAAELPPAIGLVQYDGDVHFGDVAANREQLTLWAEAAIEQGAKIVVLPEGSTYGYASATELWCAPGMQSYEGRSCRDVSMVAEALPGGPTTDYWIEFAARHDVSVVYHVPERDGDLFYASLGVVDPSGFVTRYRKRSLYYVDAAYATPGNESVVIDTPWGRFGLMICLDGTYDGPFYDEYLAAGVDGIIISMDWDDDPNGDAAAISWFRERARANDVKIYAADVSTWDGTGLYLPGNVPRERNGLPAIAIDIDGISVHPL
jgi:predicted amidohydrolase